VINENVHGAPVEKNGRITAAGGTIEDPLRQLGSGRMGEDASRGKESTSEFRVLERFGSYTLAEAHLLTGRRHFIAFGIQWWGTCDMWTKPHRSSIQGSCCMLERSGFSSPPVKRRI
jgi:hypothetical protein